LLKNPNDDAFYHVNIDMQISTIRGQDCERYRFDCVDLRVFDTQIANCVYIIIKPIRTASGSIPGKLTKL